LLQEVLKHAETKAMNATALGKRVAINLPGSHQVLVCEASPTATVLDASLFEIDLMIWRYLEEDFPYFPYFPWAKP
jgi:hypothetical protein